MRGGGYNTHVGYICATVRCNYVRHTILTNIHTLFYKHWSVVYKNICISCPILNLRFRWRTTKRICLYDHYNIMSNNYIPKHSLRFRADIPICLNISLVTYQNFNPASVITFFIKRTFVDIPPCAQCFDISLPAKETFSLDLSDGYKINNFWGFDL